MRAVLLSGNFSGEAAVPALIEALKDPESQVRYHALSALGNLMYNAEPPDLVAIVPAVTELLKDEVAARSGREPSGRVYIPDPGTKWDEALDLVSSGCRRGASLHSSL